MSRRGERVTAGEPGYAEFLENAFRRGLISREELLDHLATHGAMLQLEPPLDDDKGIDDDELAGILRNLGVAAAPLFDAFDRLSEISERVREDDE